MFSLQLLLQMGQRIKSSKERQYRVPEVEIRFLICQDKMSRQFEFWLDISRIRLDKFSGPIMIIHMKGTKVLTFSASNLERMTLRLSTCSVLVSRLTSETLSLTLAQS